MAVLVRRKLEAVVPRSVHEVASEEAEDQVSWSARRCPGRGRTSRLLGSRCIAGRNKRGQFRFSIDRGSGGGSHFQARHRSVLLRCYLFACAWLETGHGDVQSYGTGLDFNDVDAVVAGVAWNRDGSILVLSPRFATGIVQSVAPANKVCIQSPRSRISSMQT